MKPAFFALTGFFSSSLLDDEGDRRFFRSFFLSRPSREPDRERDRDRRSLRSRSRRGGDSVSRYAEPP
eukprot:CAMPEP_0184111154 /NCGR_PEP_ID=MMETSP0974-20121125/17765_1 /TAXON_ID=483370 /ORGANISM="non described non described, Strain CCMP2097" /LENGTH=67 /DNA_ID=CAMNT_0026414231 /DNA_START=117 /DNA_END=317 /DNA_ORIENTATION=-